MTDPRTTENSSLTALLAEIERELAAFHGRYPGTVHGINEAFARFGDEAVRLLPQAAALLRETAAREAGWKAIAESNRIANEQACGALAVERTKLLAHERAWREGDHEVGAGFESLPSLTPQLAALKAEAVENREAVEGVVERVSIQWKDQSHSYVRVIHTDYLPIGTRVLVSRVLVKEPENNR